MFSYTVQEVDDDSNGIEWGANSLRVVDGVDEINGVYNGHRGRRGERRMHRPKAKVPIS